MAKTPCICPSCNEKFTITEVKCLNCSMVIKGEYPIPAISALDEADEKFLYAFLKTAGNIGQLAAHYGVSRPTVRVKLRRLLQNLDMAGVSTESAKKKAAILEQLEKGEIRTAEALKLLNQL